MVVKMGGAIIQQKPNGLFGLTTEQWGETDRYSESMRAA